MHSCKCGGPEKYFGGLRMRLRSHSRDCTGKKHLGELHMRTSSMHVSFECEGPGEQLGVCCFLIGRNGSREQIDDLSNAIESRDPLKQ